MICKAMQDAAEGNRFGSLSKKEKGGVTIESLRGWGAWSKVKGIRKRP